MVAAKHILELLPPLPSLPTSGHRPPLLMQLRLYHCHLTTCNHRQAIPLSLAPFIPLPQPLTTSFLTSNHSPVVLPPFLYILRNTSSLRRMYKSQIYVFDVFQSLDVNRILLFNHLMSIKKINCHIIVSNACPPISREYTVDWNSYGYSG